MSDQVQIVLIIAVALLIVLFIFRRQLSDFRFKGGKEGLDMQLTTHKPPTELEKKSTGVNVRGNKLWGRRNKIDVQTGKSSVEENEMIGADQQINVKPEPKKRK